MSQLIQRIILTDNELSTLIFLIKKCAKFIRQDFNHFKDLSSVDRLEIGLSPRISRDVPVINMDKYKGNASSIDSLKHEIRTNFITNNYKYIELSKVLLDDIINSLEDFNTYFRYIKDSLEPLIKKYMEKFESMKKYIEFAHSSFQKSLNYKTTVKIDYKLPTTAFYESYTDAVKYVDFYPTIRDTLIINNP